MRTLDATLQAAMEAQSGEGIFQVQIHNGLHSTIDEDSTYNLTPTRYKIDNLELTVTIDIVSWYAANWGTVFVRVGRGRKVSGVDYYHYTPWYFYHSATTNRKEITLHCNIFPDNKSISTAGDGSVETTLDNAINQVNYGAGAPAYNSFSLPAETEWWHGIQFYPTGKILQAQNAANLPGILKQKYLAYLYANDNNELTAISKNYNYGNETPIAIAGTTIINITIDSISHARYFTWRDEADTIHTSGSSTRPLHNLGFIESTVTPELDGYQNGITITIPVDLQLEPLDFLEITEAANVENGNLGPRYLGYCEIIETFDPKERIAWYQTLKSIDWLSNTAGGAMPSTIERVAAYTPLVSTGFDGNLTPSVNNLQALAQAVDDLPRSLTTTERDAIATPRAGLTIFNSSTLKLNFYDGSAWRVVTST